MHPRKESATSANTAIDLVVISTIAYTSTGLNALGGGWSMQLVEGFDLAMSTDVCASISVGHTTSNAIAVRRSR
jgi:hypothetical protein